MKRAKANFARPYGLRDFEFVRAGPDGAYWQAGGWHGGADGRGTGRSRAGAAGRRPEFASRRSGRSRLGVLARREAMVRTPRSPKGVADGRVDKARLVRRPRRDVVHVRAGRRASGGRTAISRAVRGAPNRQCGIAAATRIRDASRSAVAATRRGFPPGPWREFTRCPRRDRPGADATPSGGIALRRRNSSRPTGSWCARARRSDRAPCLHRALSFPLGRHA